MQDGRRRGLGHVELARVPGRAPAAPAGRCPPRSTADRRRAARDELGVAIRRQRQGQRPGVAGAGSPHHLGRVRAEQLPRRCRHRHASRLRTRDGRCPRAASSAPDTSSLRTGRTRRPCMTGTRAQDLEHRRVDAGRPRRHLRDPDVGARPASGGAACARRRRSRRWCRRPRAPSGRGRTPASPRRAGRRRGWSGRRRGRGRGPGTAGAPTPAGRRRPRAPPACPGGRGSSPQPGPTARCSSAGPRPARRSRRRRAPPPGRA